MSISRSLLLLVNRFGFIHSTGISTNVCVCLFVSLIFFMNVFSSLRTCYAVASNAVSQLLVILKHGVSYAVPNDRNVKNSDRNGGI